MSDATRSNESENLCTVPEAAEHLGISPEAVRARLHRGSLKSVKEGGKVFVLLDPKQTRKTSDQTRTTDDRTTSEQSELASALRDHIAALERQLNAERESLNAEREASAELRRIIAGLIQRVPELEPASEPRESAKSAKEATEREDVPPSADAPGEEATEPPWWRRWFGG